MLLVRVIAALVSALNYSTWAVELWKILQLDRGNPYTCSFGDRPSSRQHKESVASRDITSRGCRINM